MSAAKMRAAKVALAVLASAAALAAAQTPGDERGLYVTYGCYQCHGYEGQGGEALRIAPTPYPFEAFAARVRRPSNEMPAYAREVLSDADLAAIYRYVRSRADLPAELPLR
jgi:mono/diheme cytochrome c family protein